MNFIEAVIEEIKAKKAYEEQERTSEEQKLLDEYYSVLNALARYPEDTSDFHENLVMRMNSIEKKLEKQGVVYQPDGWNRLSFFEKIKNRKKVADVIEAYKNAKKVLRYNSDKSSVDKFEKAKLELENLAIYRQTIEAGQYARLNAFKKSENIR